MSTYSFDTTAFGSIRCESFYDCNGTSGVDVYANGEHICEVLDINIPDEDDAESTIEFEERIEEEIDNAF